MTAKHSLLMVQGNVLFLVSGALHTSYGPAIPRLLDFFDIGADEAGLLASSHFLGAVSGMLGAIWLSRLLGPRRFFEMGSASLVIGCVGVGFAIGWPWLLIPAYLVGFGFGTTQAATVSQFAQAFGANSRFALNLLHACLSAGFVIGPLAIAVTSGIGPLTAFLIYGGLALMIVIWMRSQIVDLSISEPQDGSSRNPKPLALLTLVYAIYVAVEIGIGTWEPTYVVNSGFSFETAAIMVSVFWLAFTLGRIAMMFVGELVSDLRIIVTALVLAAVSLIGIGATSGVATLGLFTITGFFLGPIWPAGLVLMGRGGQLTISRTGVLMSGAMAGGVVSPPLLGGIIGTRPDAFPVALGALTVACIMILLIGRDLVRR